MTNAEHWYRWEGEDLIIRLTVQAGARQDEAVGIHNKRLKLRIRAPAREGLANRHLRRFLAGTLDVPISDIELIRGVRHRDKTLRLRAPGRCPEELIEGLKPR
ncbi:MAG: DUF167 family protein [Pseudomonadota bacterium]|nr:DUF167 family protein [Pseudomonadota bacterium]